MAAAIISPVVIFVFIMVILFLGGRYEKFIKMSIASVIVIFNLFLFPIGLSPILDGSIRTLSQFNQDLAVTLCIITLINIIIIVVIIFILTVTSSILV
ncbi:hypothetical protein WAK64_00995 [Bacillus spongiae]|uniref:Uncharacterized protein n=1 Tax=Bacillus spongiae TaxID=2683610 RepID=A0ABU8H8W9_9BACI